MKSPNRTTRLILIFIIILAIYASLSMYVFLRTGASKQIAKYAVQLKPQLLSFKDAIVRNDIEEQNTDRDIESIIHKQMEAKGKKKWDEAYAILIEGLAKYPKSDKLTTHLGGWFYDQGNWTMAAYWYKQAHYLNPKEHMYPMNVGLCLSNMGKEYEAVEWYQIAYNIHPQTAQLISFVNLLWKFNNWTNYDQYQKQIVSDIRDEIRENKRVSIGSYVALHLPFSLPELKAIAASDSKQIAAGAKKPDEAFQYRNDHDRIRVGYVSYDLRNHAVGLQIQSMFMYHDRSKFEIFAYNTNDGLKDPYKDHEVWRKINETCEHPVELGLFPADEAAYRINADGIDILIDLNLFTAHHRMDIFSVRPAPIQAAYLGLATTTGADWIDYLVVDKTVVPRESMEHYSEKLIFMPYSYHIFDHKQMYGQKPKGDRSQHNLPQNKFLYCNHQNNQRLYPEAFDHMVNIVKRAPDSALVLKYYNEQAASNIRVEARARGLNVSDNPHESQLIFMHGTGDGSHITMKSMCDIYLDMHNYNGHSTGGDMLWAGVPMVTFPGENMASRAGASFSKSMGAPEMIAESWQEFEDKAVNFAMNKEEYAALRKRIENNRMDSPLFDTKKWVRDLEYGLEQAYKLYREGKGKDHIYVPRDH